MREKQKEQILDIISNMHEAHTEIKKAVGSAGIAVVQNMMCDLQEVAIAVGNSIEESEGEGFITVDYLSLYCETLYQILEKIQMNSIDSIKAYKLLEKSLLKIENSINTDIIGKKEIAFFPYKASMWDSLESIYLKLKEDKNNDVYCVPIPYYDLNLDRSFGQMHYEGYEYPKNIEITDYKTYNFEERQPDEIYIHSPYDSYNFVTSVEPRFYARNLRKYTEKLVYSPYFVLREIEPDNQVEINAIKHFIWLPGVIYADEVILQSEKMKQIYVNEYLKEAKASGLTGKHIDRAYLEEKFKGTGSPKIDKILRTEKNKLDIPDEWVKLIENQDGSWKKVILYNTGVTALLKYSEKWLDKIEDNLKIFKDNQEKVTLLWRPHPLIESTIKSMRPQLIHRYSEIKEQYIREGWGIYDDTTDLDRAVVLSDAYYGDLSSVVNLFQQLKKPIMIQEIWQ